MKIFGKNAVIEALGSNMAVSGVVVSENVKGEALAKITNLAKKRNVKIKSLPNFEFKRLVGDEPAQGVIADVEDFVYTSLDELLKDENAFLVLLDGVEDPHNLGAIIRTAECCGATGIVIQKNRAASVNGTVAKVSAGALAHVKIAQVSNLHDAIDRIKDAGIFVYAADMDGEVMYKTNLEGKIAIVVGGEGKGVSALSRKKVDGIVSIPMFGKVNSLNASVSAAVVLYEVVRQRTQNDY